MVTVPISPYLYSYSHIPPPAHKPTVCKSINLNSSRLLEVLSDSYIKGNKNDIEIFSDINDLNGVDAEELKKFSLVSCEILANSPNKSIDKTSLRSFSHRHKRV